MQTTVRRPWLQWYDEGLKSLQFPEMSIYSLLETSVKRFPDNTAIIFKDILMDYKTLKQQVDKLAGEWREMGFQKGDRIALMMSNHPYYIVSYYAAHALGLVVVQVNPMYTPRELIHILNDTTAKYIVFDQNGARSIGKIKESYQFDVYMTIDDHHPEALSLRGLIEDGQEIEVYEQVDPLKDVAVIQYTGGTTGKMKGVMLTHHNLTSNVVQGVAFFGNSMVPGKEVVLTAIPLYHVYGMTTAMNLCIYVGGAILLFAKFELEDVLLNVKKYRPTFFPGVPKMYHAFASHPEIEKFGLHCLKNCSCGSAPLPVEILKRFDQLTGAKIAEGFGLSEASPATHRNPKNRKIKVGSIGVPYPGTDCRIVDKNNQNLDPMCVGELVIKGPQVMKGYWNNEAETKQALQDGWLYTGDLGMMDEEGYFYLVGRKKEMIIVDGFNVYPQEIESVLYEYPDIQEATVAGIPHPELGEVVTAFIVPKNGVELDLEEVKDFCYTRLTRYKVPKKFEVRQELPRTPVGKILKRKLVEEELQKREGKES